MESMPTPRAPFPPTAWSLLAGFAAGGSARAKALSELARRYWMPVYVYVRRKGKSAADAQDLVQSFFVHLLEKELLARPDPSRGRFRSWLLAVLEHFLANEARIRAAQKRGKGKKIVPLDVEGAEQAVIAGGGLDPEAAFARTWALEVLQRAFRRLEQEFAAAGKQAVLAKLRRRMGLPAGAGPEEDASDVAVHRARKRWKALVLDEVGDSVRDSDQISSEVGDLFRALGRDP